MKSRNMNTYSIYIICINQKQFCGIRMAFLRIGRPEAKKKVNIGLKMISMEPVLIKAIISGQFGICVVTGQGSQVTLYFNKVNI